MEPVVHLRSTVALLGRFPALTGVDLDVEAGEIVLITGPNGAGKTTLLRCCAGLVAVTSGTARVLGVDLVVDRRAVRPMVGLLGHSTGLYDELTVADNLRFWARVAGLSAADATAAMDRVGIVSRLRDVAVGAVLALTWVIAIVFLALGIVRLIAGFQFWSAGGWLLVLSGVFGIIAGIIILSGWPESSMWVIGLLLGIDLIFSGVGWLTYAAASPSR